MIVKCLHQRNCCCRYFDEYLLKAVQFANASYGTDTRYRHMCVRVCVGSAPFDRCWLPPQAGLLGGGCLMFVSVLRGSALHPPTA
jgi:hypothetical protein